MKQKYIDTRNDDLLPDLEYYSSRLYDDNQQLLIIRMACGIDE